MKNLTASFLIFLLAACAHGRPPPAPPKPKPDLYEEAERASEKISERLEQKRSASASETQEQIERSEEQTRLQAIRKYRALLAKKDRLQPATVETCMLNLGHLLFDQCLARYRAQMRAYDEAYKRYQLGYAKSEPATLPRYDFRPAREVYEAFLEAFPSSPHRPEVLYNLAYSYEEEGDLDKAVALYEELALTAPSARFAPEIYMRLGEHSFETNRFNKAIEYYEKVLALGETPLYEKALFKIGWSRYAMSQFDKAREVFARVLELHTSGKGKERGDLYQEALEILAKILSETGGAVALSDFLKAHDHPPYGIDLSIQLGSYFQETARYQEAIETYRKILSTYPYAAQAPFVEQSLIECLKTEKRDAEAEALQASLMDRYGEGTPWYEKNTDPDLRKRVDAILWSALKQQLFSRHRLARETKDPKEYQKALALYRRALAYLPEDERAYETRYRYAECLFESGRLKEAAAEYERVSKVELYGRYREKAASMRIQCLETLRGRKEVQIDTLLAAYGDFLELFPESPKTAGILFKQGEILYNAARYDQAAGIFRRIIREHPRHKDILRAWLLEAEALFEAKRYAELEQCALHLLAQEFALTGAQRSRVDHLLRFAQFEEAREDQNTEHYLAAAERYERIVEEAPGIEIAPDALFNAAICYQNAGAPDRAAACFEKIVVHYPASKHYADALLAPLPYYEKTRQWDRLLLHIDKLRQRDPENALAKETLYKLGKRFYKEGDYGRAREIFSRYRRHYPSDTPRRLEIAYLEARMKEEEGRPAEALDEYRKFLSAYRKAKAADKALAVDPLYLATARFRTLEPVYRRYRAIRLREPLKKNLAAKQALLDKVVAGYVQTAKSGAADFALASAYRIGEAYEEFWKSLLESEIPAGLSDEEMKVYKGLLAEQAAPYREKAVAAYETTLKSAGRRKIFNPWVLRTYERLSRLVPDQYPPMLKESVVWEERWRAKRSLIRALDASHPRDFSQERAACLQAEMDKALKGLQKGIRSGDLGRARILQTIDHLEHLLEKELSLYEAAYDLGILYDMLGEEEEARRAYERSLKENPENPLAHLNLGLLDLQGGRPDRAEGHFRALARLSPRYAGAYYLLGVCYDKQGEYEKAVEPLERAITLLPQFLDPYVELGTVRRRLGEEEAARKLYRAVLQHPKASGRVLRTLGYRLLEAGWTTEAVEAYGRILRGREATYGDWNNRGVAYLRAGNLNRAHKDLENAQEAEPGRPEAFNNMGRLYMERGAYQEAASSFHQALKLDPACGEALLNATVLYGQYLQDMEKARAYLRRYLEGGGTFQRAMFEEWLTGSEEEDAGTGTEGTEEESSA